MHYALATLISPGLTLCGWGAGKACLLVSVSGSSQLLVQREWEPVLWDIIFLTPRVTYQSLCKAKSHKTHTPYQRETRGKGAPPLGGVFKRESTAAPQRLCFVRKGWGWGRSWVLRHLGSVRWEPVLAGFLPHLGIRVTQQLLWQPSPAAGHVAEPWHGNCTRTGSELEL